MKTLKIGEFAFSSTILFLKHTQMKKNLLSAGVLLLGISANAQFLSYVGGGSTVTVTKNTLVYNGGGLKVDGTGKINNSGNIMMVGTTTGTASKIETSSADSFINKLNEPNNYASTNSTDPSVAPVYTYGQLFITGITQANIEGSIGQEYRQVKQGAYQQMGIPFFGKTITSLGTDLGKTFNVQRRSENEILPWNNRNVEFDNLSGIGFKFGEDAKPFTYYTVGGKNLDVTSAVKTLKGRPVSDALNSEKKLQLQDAGLNINFGTGTGNVINGYGGRYNTYVQDGFEIGAGGVAWIGDFGRNIYQFGNPYLTNLDLSQIAIAEAGAPGDGNNLSNIYGVRLDVSGVTFNPNRGGGSTSYKAITFNTGVATGDVEYQVIRPMGTFVIKLKNNSVKPTLDLSTLRRFKYNPRSADKAYNVTAAKSVKGVSTVKQLGVIGLDVDGNEVERTYYVVSSNTVSGNSANVKAQIGGLNGALLGTYEEDAINGGYDNNNVSYWLYLNEANENDFKGKNIKLVNNNDKIVAFKFEIRENAILVEDGQHLLSQGEGFYISKESGGTIKAINQNLILNTVAGNFSSGIEYNLYYGEPQVVLASAENIKKSSTIIVFNPELDNYFVKFDNEWKTADIKIFDMSGRLVNDVSKISAKQRYYLPLKKGAAAYIVHIISEKGEVVVSKVIR